MHTANRLLLSLAPTDFEALSREMQPMTFRPGTVLYEPEDEVRWVYFPEQGLISLLSVMLSGTAVETAVVGNEGGVGVLEATGEGVIFSRAVVQVHLLALRVPVTAYRAAFDASATLRRSINSHTELLIVEARQTLACQTHHSHEQRLAWWLLECQDRNGGGSTLPLKQDFLAAMLGVQRSTVSQVAGALKAEVIIDYSRGEIEILDRARLESRSCECYATNSHFRQLIEVQRETRDPATRSMPQPDTGLSTFDHCL
ncbi:MAG: Crp/Fnr family transcriptional regulator [Caulobacteraceae bacterium]